MARKSQFEMATEALEAEVLALRQQADAKEDAIEAMRQAAAKFARPKKAKPEPQATS